MHRVCDSGSITPGGRLFVDRHTGKLHSWDLQTCDPSWRPGRAAVFFVQRFLPWREVDQRIRSKGLSIPFELAEILPAREPSSVRMPPMCARCPVDAGVRSFPMRPPSWQFSLFEYRASVPVGATLSAARPQRGLKQHRACRPALRGQHDE